MGLPAWETTGLYSNPKSVPWVLSIKSSVIITQQSISTKATCHRHFNFISHHFICWEQERNLMQGVPSEAFHTNQGPSGTRWLVRPGCRGELSKEPVYTDVDRV